MFMFYEKAWVFFADVNALLEFYPIFESFAYLFLTNEVPKSIFQPPIIVSSLLFVT